MLAWILETAGLEPGFLIGGVPRNFGVSARLGSAPFFVVEADEYDTAFFDKRSKFVHYRPRTLILNNLEFDHADIFDDLRMIQRQFHHLVRTVPGNGLIVHAAGDEALNEVLAMGCWTPCEHFDPAGSGDWQAADVAPDGSRFEVVLEGQPAGRIAWELSGWHNIGNALAALAAARHVGVPVATAIAALSRFTNVKRRMELQGQVADVRVYDDFAHHPTAIATTLEGLRAQVGERRIIAVLEPRSNTMRMGVHRNQLAASLVAADRIFLCMAPDLDWNPGAALAPLGDKAQVADSVSEIVSCVAAMAQPGDQVLVMSNGGFGNIHQRLLQALTQKFEQPGEDMRFAS
jgi:UDP-N-acetylmuramate: L-alanyl-gamma-D-glutamyl-meso-diaminopimelate ligase